MTSDQLDRTLRDALRTWPVAEAHGGEDVARRIVRRRRRRTVLRGAGAALGVCGIAAGTVFAFAPDSGGGAQQPAAQPTFANVARWHATLPDRDVSACAADSSAVYCNGGRWDGIKIDVHSGRLVWTFRANGTASSTGSALPGVHDGVLYTFANHFSQRDGTHEDSSGRKVVAQGTDLVAVDGTTKRPLWHRQLNSDNRDDQAALLFDGGILANSPHDRDLTALDARTGRTLWTYRIPKGVWCDRTTVNGTPYLLCREDDAQARDDTQVIRLDPASGETRTVGSAPGHTALVGVDGTTLLLAPDPGAPDPGTRKRSTPLKVITFDTGTGRAEEHRLSGPAGVPAVAGGTLFVTAKDGTVSAYEPRTGKKLWTGSTGLEVPETWDPIEQQRLTGPAVDTGNGIAYWLSPSGRIAGLDLKTGTARWHGAVKLPRQSGHAYPLTTAQILPYGDGLIVRVGADLFSVRPDLG